MKFQGFELEQPLIVEKENSSNISCEFLEWHRSGFEGDLELCGQPSLYIVKQNTLVRHMCKYHTKYIQGKIGNL